MIETTRQGKVRLPSGGQIAHTILGKDTGAPPILLNRPLGGSMALWGAFATRLARSFQVIAFDPLGVGRSSDVPMFHSTRRMAGDVLELMNALQVPRAHVFGLSLGALVATWIGIDAPQRTASLILASMPEALPVTPAHIARQAAAMLRWLVKPGRSGEVELVEEALSPQLRQADPERVHEIESRVRAIPSKRLNLLKLAVASALYSGGGGLGRLHVPTLVLRGQWDPVARAGAAMDPAQGIPGARVETIPGAGQDMTLEQPVETADRIVAFLRTLNK